MPVLVLLFLVLLPLRAVAADGCIDAWYTRNLIFDRAGHCFGSALGQALFDNSDCTSSSPTLDPAAQALVNELHAREKRHGCQMDTRQAVLDLPDMAFRKVLWDLPVRSEDAGWACYGWKGGQVPLFYGYRDGAPQIGWVMPGDGLMFEHDAVNNWRYVTVWHPPYLAALKSAGWLAPGIETRCAEEAG